MNKSLFLLALVLFTVCCQAQTNVSVVDCPDREQTNANYTNFREPLQQAPLLSAHGSTRTTTNGSPTKATTDGKRFHTGSEATAVWPSSWTTKP